MPTVTQVSRRQRFTRTHRVPFPWQAQGGGLPVLRGATGFNSGAAATTTINVTFPTAVQLGDLLLIYSAQESSVLTTWTCTAPVSGAAFTQVPVGGDGVLTGVCQLLWKWADAQDVTNCAASTAYTVTESGSHLTACVAAAYGNVGSFDPYPDSSGKINPSSTTITVNGLVTTKPNSTLVWFGFGGGGGGATPAAVTAPSGFTAEITQSNTTSSSGTNVGLLMADKEQAANGASGSMNGTLASGHTNGGVAIALAGIPPAKAAPTQVTATQGGSTANGLLLRVMVLTQQAASPIGATAAAAASSVSITTTQTGSRVYGATIRASGTANTPVSGTTLIDDVQDTTLLADYTAWKTTALTGTPGATTVGCNFGPGVAALEVKTAGALTEEGSAPAPAVTLTATTVQTEVFTPPLGSLLVAIISSDGAGSVTTMAVSDTTGLTWTEQVKQNPVGNGYVGVWTAPVTAGGGPSAGVATLTAALSITAPAAVELAPATLLPLVAITDAATMDAPATLLAGGTMAAPAAVQLAPATLAAALSIPAPLVVQQATATLAAGVAIPAPASTQVDTAATLAALVAITDAATLDAPATLTAGGSIAAPDVVQRAVATLTSQVAVSDVAVQLAVATLAGAFTVSALARQLAVATLAAQATITDTAVQQAIATLAAAAVVQAGTGATGAASLVGTTSMGLVVATQGAAAVLAAAAALPAPVAGEAATALLAALAAVNASGVQTFRTTATLAVLAVLQASGGALAAHPPAYVRAGNVHQAWAALDGSAAWAGGEPHGGWAARPGHSRITP